MNKCPQCGSTFECGAQRPPQEPCWCAQLPPLPPGAYAPAQSAACSCLCPDCLRAQLIEAGALRE